jgi:hypothetical protein
MVKCPSLLSDFNQNCDACTNFSSVVLKLLQADGANFNRRPEGTDFYTKHVHKQNNLRCTLFSSALRGLNISECVYTIL